MEPQRLPRFVAGALFLGLFTPRETFAEGLELGPFELGGAARVNVLDKSWETRDRRFPRADLELDTLRARLDFERGEWTGSAQYRYYYYNETDRSTHFLHHAWLDYSPAPGRHLRFGVNQVPFGNLPFNSHSYFFSLAYYLGLEDDYDLGIRYTDEREPWRLDLAWYFADEGDGFGDSTDSARYSYDVVRSTNSANEEQDQANARLSYAFDHGEPGSSELGVSLQSGRIPNEVSGGTGSHLAAAVHWNADFGPWNVKLESAYYDYDLDNPPEQAEDSVVLGAYDFPYQAASGGTVHSVGVSYHFDVDYRRLEGITVYNDYSVLLKDAGGFQDSHHNVIGASFDLPPFFIYTDLALGRNNAWIGPDFGTALAGGGPDDDLNYRLNLNIGVYF